MAETRRHSVVKLLITCFLAAVMCKELSSTGNEELVHIMSRKSRVESSSRRRGDMTAKRDIKEYSSIHPPKHVMKIMHRLSQDEDLFQDSRGNVARSYLPTLSFICSEPSYIFNIRPHTAEILRSLKLHFFAPKPSTMIGSHLTIDIHLHFITDTSSGCRSIGVQQIPPNARGWQVVDITSQISQFINRSIESSIIKLGVSFQAQTAKGSNGNHHRDTISKIISHHARPFLLMLAQEDYTDGRNSVFPWSEEESRPTHTPHDTSKVTEQLGHSRHTRSVDNKGPSITTNEFPQRGANLAHQATFQHFTQQDSKRRKAKKRASKRRKVTSKKRRKAPLMDQSSSAIEDKDLNPGVTIDERDQNTVMSEDPNRGACSRHSMFVGFDTIDWARYVIAPSGFQAFYCAGECRFPLFKSGNPSNHATIQSVMSVSGVQPKIPSPCCVPDKLSSLTLLFFDEDGNLELKTYQNMVVESCGCR